MATARARFLKQRFGGYFHRDIPPEDTELTHVGSGTPGGEYLRRFWQPVCFSDDLKDLPFKVRMLGEDLVAYRDKRGTVGLLELNCRQGGRCAGGTSSSGVLPCALVAHRIKPYVTTR